MFLWAVWLKPDLRTEPISHPASEVKEILEARDVQLNPKDPPVVYVPVDYSEGPPARWYPKNESPILRELVREGKLPPLHERLPEDPLVLEGPEGIGKFGGAWQRVAPNRDECSIIRTSLSDPGLVGWSPQGYPIIPNLARKWEVSTDFREWIFFLRNGLRWSDGQPFSTDDIIFWWEDLAKFLSSTRPEWMRIAGHVGEIVKVDDLTVKFVFPVSYPAFLERFAAEGGAVFAPGHWLGRYHPEKLSSNTILNAPTRSSIILDSMGAIMKAFGPFRTAHACSGISTSSPSTIPKLPSSWSIIGRGSGCALFCDWLDTASSKPSRPHGG